MNRTWIIYTLADPRTEEVRYVGVTFRGKQRFNEHLSRARKDGQTHRDCWIRSLLKLDLKPIKQTVQTGSGDGWQEAERTWIAHHRSLGRLVNHTDGGEGTPGYVPTPELRDLWSKQRKGKAYAPGRRPAMLGRQHSTEARQKIRAAGTGRRRTEETRLRMSAGAKRRGMPQATIEASVAARQGRPLSEDHKAKIAASTETRKPVLCVETGEVFPSVKAVCKALDVPNGSINQAIRKGCRCLGNHYRFA